MSTLELFGGESVFRVLAWLLLIEAFTIALLQAGNVAHSVSREAIIFFWSSFLLIASRIVIRSELNAQRYSWWGNICWLILILAAARLLYEHATGKPGWPAKDHHRGTADGGI